MHAKISLVDQMTNHSHKRHADCPAKTCNSTPLAHFNASSGDEIDLADRYPNSEITNYFQPIAGFVSFEEFEPNMSTYGPDMNMNPYFRTPHINLRPTMTVSGDLNASNPNVCVYNGSYSRNIYSALHASEPTFSCGDYVECSFPGFGKVTPSDISDPVFRLKSEVDFQPRLARPAFVRPPAIEVNLIERLSHQNNLKIHTPRLTECASSTSFAQEQDNEQVDDDQKCKNTVEGTKTSVRRFKRWYKEKCGWDLDMNCVNRFSAPEMLKEFFLDIRDTRPGRAGNEYEPVTLTTYRNGLRRYFLYRKVPPAADNFDLTDKSFDVVNRVLVSKRDDLKRKGKGNHPNAVESITSEQLEKMWASGAIGGHAPRPLLRLMWWYNTVYHGLRGRMAHHDLNMEDFVASSGIDGKISLECCKRVTDGRDMLNSNLDSQTKTKNRGRVSETDGSDRDPVHAFELFRLHRPPGISSFYLTPKSNPKGEVWYNKVPMGKNSIGRIMREIKSISGIF